MSIGETGGEVNLPIRILKQSYIFLVQSRMELFIDKVKGTIYGQAIGDALGFGTEFMSDEDMVWK